MRAHVRWVRNVETELSQGAGLRGCVVSIGLQQRKEHFLILFLVGGKGGNASCTVAPEGTVGLQFGLPVGLLARWTNLPY